MAIEARKINWTTGIKILLRVWVTFKMRISTVRERKLWKVKSIRAKLFLSTSCQVIAEQAHDEKEEGERSNSILYKEARGKKDCFVIK